MDLRRNENTLQLLRFHLISYFAMEQLTLEACNNNLALKHLQAGNFLGILDLPTLFT